MYRKVILTLCAIKYCSGQSFNSPALDWIQTDDNTGAYRFGYATGDEGHHYHVSSATADNTVAGRFGYKDPVTGGDLQTTYTAGRRGFRARGPHIARRMDLSQNKPPFSRPDDDGQYHPELDNYFDPNEDRGYDFSYRTPDHIKEEHANRVGDVQGRYSYLDDIGFRHNVEYIAGSKTGFVVTNPVPDTFAQARGGPLYFVGKAGGSKVRGFSAVQKNLNGAYRFLASGPDHKRSEISDSSGNRRGVYSYLDDKGIQHTVEYIAGPKIGYKVISNRKGVSYNPPLPYFPDSPTVPSLFPSSPAGGVDSSSGGNKPFALFPSAASPSSPPKGDDLFTPITPSDSNNFPSFSAGSGSGPLSSSSPVSGSLGKPSGTKTSGDISSGKPSSGQPPSLTDIPSSNVPPFSFEQPEDFPSISPTFPSTSPFPIPAKPQDSGKSGNTGQQWNYDFDQFFNDPTSSNKDWSKPVKGSSGNKVTTTPKPPTFEPFPDFSPSPFPDPSYLIPDAFNEGLNTAESINGLKPPFDNQDKNLCKDNNESSLNNQGYSGSTSGQKNKYDQTGKTDSFFDPKEGKGDGAKHYYKGGKGIYYPSRGTVKFGGTKKKDWRKTENEEGYFAIPPGVAVRAHVQSLDIVPYKRFESPGDALKHHDDKREKAVVGSRMIPHLDANGLLIAKVSMMPDSSCHSSDDNVNA